jgi:serine/threonine-protein kinase
MAGAQNDAPDSEPGPTLPPAPPEGIPTMPSIDRDLELPDTIPGYELIRELGRGGMGVVYVARQIDLNRTVALKVMLAGCHASSTERARFAAEAKALARLHHPNVVQIYDVGMHSGQSYLTEEFCSGGSLAGLLASRSLGPRRAAAMVEAIARGVHAAHEAGVIHRDLKPANILLDNSGNPKVTDFGLAKQTDSTAHTGTGAVLGTPGYMAPEQIDGAKRVGPTADVYALGAILYECLAGRPPYKAATAIDTLMKAMEEDPPPPSHYRPELPRDLEAICMKCLERNPNHRYASAAALSADLRRFLDGEPISVSSYRVLGRLARTLDRTQHDAEFHGWGPMLYLFGVIILFNHVAVGWVIVHRLPLVWSNVAQYAGGLLMLAVFVRNRIKARRILPASVAERTLFSIWIGYLIGCAVVTLSGSIMFGRERYYDAYLYPFWATLSGMGFIAMGGGYWGRCYLFGVAFFAAALGMTQIPMAAPFLFGLMWSLCLVLVGRHMQNRAAEIARERAAGD